MGRTIDTQTLVVGTAGAVGSGATAYSESFNFKKTTGFICVYVSSSAAGSTTVTQQCSLDNVTFYDPVDSDGNALGQVVAALGAATVYVQTACVMAPYMRYKVVEGGTSATNVVIKLMWQAETRR